MKRPRRFRSALGAAALVSVSALMTVNTPAIANVGTGPSTHTLPYLLPVVSGVETTSLFTVGDGAAGNGYQMVGIPDGMGAYLKSSGTRAPDIVVLMNHELRDTAGIVRRHGQKGAFVSRLVLDGQTMRVKSGRDLINPSVKYWDYPSARYVTAAPKFADGTDQQLAFSRFCSGTLSAPGIFWNPASGKGTHEQIYFANEENGEVGRVFGVTTAGNAKALPRIGLASWENNNPAANLSDTTLLVASEDGPGDGSQLWTYVGTKQSKGSAVDRAGLTNGQSYVIDAVNQLVTNDAQFRAAYGKGVGAPVTLSAVDWKQPGAAQNAEAKAKGLSLNRVEDGVWDPNFRNDFYFVTTEGGAKDGLGIDARDGGGLWRLSFKDIDHPAAGATLTLLLDGSEDVGFAEPKINKPDNMTLDRHGNLLIQEDPGGNNHVARVLAYRVADGALGVAARFDPALFGPGAVEDPLRLTIDEESSGVIDAEALFGEPGAFLLDTQIHTNKGLPAGTGPGTVEEYVERGQLLRLDIHDWDDVYNR